jgi:hypothetical protein
MKDGTHQVWGDQEKGAEVSDARLNPRWELRCLGHSRIRATNIGDEGVDTGGKSEEHSTYLLLEELIL